MHNLSTLIFTAMVKEPHQTETCEVFSLFGLIITELAPLVNLREKKLVWGNKQCS